MGFVVYRNGTLQSNERMIAFYKKELTASHIIDTAKKQKHYGTKWYRKAISMQFPSARRYERIKAIIGNAYRKSRRTYAQMSQLGKKI